MAESLIQGLRARGIDVRSANDDRMVGRSDEEQLRWAAQHGRALVAFNVGDFYRIHADFVTRGDRHAGIVLVQQRRGAIGTYLQGLFRLAAARSAEEMMDQVTFLRAWIAR